MKSTDIFKKIDIVITEDPNIPRKEKTFYFIITETQSTGGSGTEGEMTVSPTMGIKII